jgi:MFS family permease
MSLLQKQRLAVAAIFFMNGFDFANIMARLPEIQSLYGMNNAVLGTVLFCRAIGAVVAMPFTAWLSATFSSGQITRAMATFFVLCLPALVLMPSVLVLTVVLFFIGMAEGVLDVNMNEQAVLIERGYERPIMSSFHAVFSGGMALGASGGAAIVYFNVPLLVHFSIIAAASLVLIFVVNRHFVQTEKQKNSDQPLFMLPSKAILPLGIIAFCCMTGEGSMVEWSAVYMKQVLTQPESFAAMALAVFNYAMLTGRIFGDKLNHRLGQRRLLILDATTAAVGLTLVLAVPTVWAAMVGFMLVGLGLSTIVPIVYSVAGNTEGVSPSAGIAMATSIGYAGFFVGPPTIGYLAEWQTLRVGLLFTLFLFVIMWFLIFRGRVN